MYCCELGSSRPGLPSVSHKIRHFYYRDQKQWQVIKAGTYIFNNNVAAKDKFSLKIDRAIGEKPKNEEVWIKADGNRVCPLDVPHWEKMYIDS